jgi:hypothetical protein
VALKQEELKRSRWLNPTVIGLFAAALGLIGSVVVAGVNNSNSLRVTTSNNDASQRIEHSRAQSNLVLEAIKTGNPDTACQNLVVFVGLGLLDDPGNTIQHQCAAAPKGGPSLPSSSSPETTLSSAVHAVEGMIRDHDTQIGIAGAVLRIESGEGDQTKLQTASSDLNGRFRIILPLDANPVEIVVNSLGYVPKVVRVVIPQHEVQYLTIELQKQH